MIAKSERKRQVNLTDPDNPEWSEADFAAAKPGAEVLPADVLAQFGKAPRGRPKAESPKMAVKLRLDADLIEHAKAGGPGWQTRINAAIRQSFFPNDAKSAS